LSGEAERAGGTGEAAGPLRDRIVLVGFMGCGKSTVGPLVAGRLGWGFLDLDAWIEGRNGRSVDRIFAEDGEAFFRWEERLAAEAVRDRKRCVVAAGGGAFAVPRTRELLRDGAVSVWLRCDAETLLERVFRAGGRPLATNRERMLELLAGREASYRLADLAVEASRAAPEEVASSVVEAVTRQGFRGLPGRQAP
jgi:shikimate kinase